MSERDVSKELLDELDDARTSRFHLKTIFVAGMGFFSDAYDLFVLSTALPAIVAVFGITSSSNLFGASTVNFLGVGLSAVTIEEGLIGAAALFGAFVGALVFGRIADLKGRKYTYGVEMSILVIFALVSAFSVNIPMLIISRFILGIGVGGDYPISSTIMSEYSNVKNRGKMIASVFAMQGFGLLTGSLIGIVAIHFLPLDEAWRFMLGFGAVPALSVIYLRRKIRETPRYKLQVQGDVNGASLSVKDATGKTMEASGPVKVSKNSFWDTARKYRLLILGTAGSWLLFDMAFYGTSVNSGLILQDIGYGSVAGNLHQTIFNIAVGNTILAALFEVPGYWIAVAAIDRVGRKKLQWIGFTVMAVAYLILALTYTSIVTSLTLFLAVYGISFLFGNIGPNTTTFVLPTELFPTQFRTTGHGIAASMGKFGAGIFTFLEPILQFVFKLQGVFAILVAVSLLGVMLTLLTITETKKRSLESTSAITKAKVPD
ncbi:putative 3-hydroxyphenylpropionic transporter MhpT [Thermoplasmatales archaeon]|nr:putative 3-hydroxyphenylpropionic transporter MhpT [Thermoplasmatales archaeon]